MYAVTVVITVVIFHNIDAFTVLLIKWMEPWYVRDFSKTFQKSYWSQTFEWQCVFHYLLIIYYGYTDYRYFSVASTVPMWPSSQCLAPLRAIFKKLMTVFWLNISFFASNL